jgi:hypothetical protein
VTLALFHPFLLCISEGGNCICRGGRGRLELPAMRIAKPLLLVSTPLGIVTGLIEAYRLVGGLALLMFAMMGMLGIAAAGIVMIIRKEKRWTESRS